MNRFIKGIGIVLLLAVVGMASAVAVIALLLRQEEVRVPELVGQDIVNVIDLMNSKGLQLKVDRREPSQTVPKDSIVSQSPLPGTGIKKGRAVRVVVSQGPTDFLVPRIVGEPYRKAELILRQGGLPSPDVARVWSEKIERDIVIAQDPPAGAPLEKNGRIGILVSIGKKGSLYVTPRLVGKRAEEAVRLVDRMGLQYRLTTRPSATGAGAERLVVAQKPLPGHPLPAEGTVELEVSK